MEITYLEMLDPASLQAATCPDGGFVVLPEDRRDGEVNRRFYEEVGAACRWTDKLEWSEVDWRAYACQPALHTHVARLGGEPAGYFELLEENGEVQIAYFGLLPAFVGHGLGGYLLTVALQQAWALDPSRVWVHTCELDHPAALANYQARGMRIYRKEQV